MLNIGFSQLTDAGCVRDDNEDAIGSWPLEGGLLFAVADGIGGQNAGQVASALAMEVVSRDMLDGEGGGSLQNRLRQAVQKANLEIYQKGMTVPELRRMGTTLTVSALVGHTLVAAHVGDTRLYLLRKGTLTQLTKDHTWVAEQVRYGILSPEDARDHPNRHILSRCMGHELIAAIDVLSINIEAGDRVVQCTDGVHDSLPDSEMERILREGESDSVCKTVIARSREAGGEDNLSIQVASVISCPSPSPRPWWKFGR